LCRLHWPRVPQPTTRAFVEEEPMTTRTRIAPLVAGIMLIISGCASLTVDSTWRDPTYQGQPFVKVLVVGSTDDADNRRIFEDVLVNELKNRGVDAVASHTLIPNGRDVTRDKVVEAVKTSGTDSVLSTRLVGIETRATRVSVAQSRAADIDLYSYYSPLESQPTVRQDYQVANLESNLFDGKTGKMVWWGRSQTFPTENVQRLSRELGAAVIRSLKAANLL
jgi:hypothetical protein